MQPRSEPLLWLQCLALGAIPLELLLIRLVLAGADPGPVPGVERFLIWGVGVLAPAVALWRRPADWGSLLLVRQPLANRNGDQLRISASHSGLNSRIAVVIAAVILLPALWWLDDSAVLASEFSPVSGQSRLVTLLLVSPLLALLVWQAQQLVQAATLLFGSATVGAADEAFRADAVATQRTSLGLQLLNLPALDWPEPAPPPATPEPEAKPSQIDNIEESAAAEAIDHGDQAADVDSSSSGVDNQDDTGTEAEEEAESNQPHNDGLEEPMSAEPTEPDTDDSTEDVATEDEGSAINPAMADEPNEGEAEELDPVDESIDNSTDSLLDVDSSQDEAPEDDGAEDDGAEEDGEEDADGEQDAQPPAPTESVAAATPSLPIEPEQAGKEEKGATLNPEISQIDGVTSGSTEGHREQTEPSGSKESEPEQPSETPPGSL